MSDNKEKALEEKERGNAAYKRKDFPTALKHYDKAIEKDPTNIIFLTNKGAVYFEQKEYDDCIKICEKAVEVGRHNNAESEQIAKALGRIGKSYFCQNDLSKALTYYNQSKSEFQLPGIEMEIKKIEETIEEKVKVKEYLRQGAELLAKKKPTEAAVAFQEALKIDSNNKEALEEYKKALLAESEDPEAVRKKAMSNPEVEKIINNEILQKILEKMSSDPKDAESYLKEPNVAAEIQNLMAMSTLTNS